MNKKMIIVLSVLVGIFIILGIVIWKNDHTRLRKSVKLEDLTGKTFILCKYYWVTGFDWEMIRNTKGEDTSEFVTITGVDPWDEIRWSMLFPVGENIFVFYVEEEREYHSEVTKRLCTEYIVSGWDILYPVKHFFPFGSKWYILSGDRNW